MNIEQGIMNDEVDRHWEERPLAASALAAAQAICVPSFKLLIETQAACFIAKAEAARGRSSQ